MPQMEPYFDTVIYIYIYTHTHTHTHIYRIHSYAFTLKAIALYYRYNKYLN